MIFSKTEKNILNQNGFTLVELMVVVAIIGLLSAVAIPNFQKYQARSKTAEAKLQLAAIYTAEQSFYADYNIYLTCLKYMGYDPTDEGNSRYYTMGFSSTDTVDPGAYTSAQNSGLAAGECPSTLAGAGNGHYLGLKKVASSPATLAHHVTSGVGRSFVGTQAAEATQTFTAGAAGVVHKKFVSATDSSYMTIDEDKVIRIIRNGF